MKNTYRNIRTLAALLIASAAITACTNEDSGIIDNAQPAQQQGPQVYTLNISASKGGDATTRALDLEGTKLVASWTDGDELTVINLTNSYTPLTGTLTASNASGSTATFSGTLSGTIAVGDQLLLNYQEHDYFGSEFKSQVGTLKGTNGAEKYDCANAIVTVASVDGSGNITISESAASFTTHTAMLKFTLQDGSSNLLNATSLTISVGDEELYTFSPTAATYTTNGNGILYFAMPSAENVAYMKLGATPETIETKKTELAAATVTFTATVGGNTYIATKTGYPFEGGKYYKTTLTMVKVYTLAESTVGMIVGTDGKAYAASDKNNLPSGVTAAGMVAYKNGSNGLVIALADEANTMNWSTANGASGAAAHTPAVSGQTWKLPSKAEWNQMFGNDPDTDIANYFDLNNAISTAGGTELQDGLYWSSTEYEYGIPYEVELTFGSAYWRNNGYEDDDCRVRACLAF